jgi:hypothetical protein
MVILISLITPFYKVYVYQNSMLYITNIYAKFLFVK